MPDADCQCQRPLKLDLREANACPRLEPTLLVRIDPRIQLLLQCVELPLRRPPVDLHLEVLSHVT